MADLVGPLYNEELIRVCVLKKVSSAISSRQTSKVLDQSVQVVFSNSLMLL